LNSTKKITYWQLKFELPQEINWRSADYSFSNWIYTITPKSWNKVLNPWQEFQIWFCSKGPLRDKNWQISKNVIEDTGQNESLNNDTDEDDSWIDELNEQTDSDSNSQESQYFNSEEEDINQSTTQDNTINSKDNDDSGLQINTLFAPYVDSTLYPFPLLLEISKQTDNYNYVLGFIVSKSNQCIASWWGYYDIERGPDAWIDWQHKYLYDEVKAVQNVGWKVMVSFGWQAWIPLFRLCDEEALLKQYEKVINNLNTYYLDFDIEWESIRDHTNIDKLINILLKLQKEYSGRLHI